MGENCEYRNAGILVNGRNVSLIVVIVSECKIVNNTIILFLYNINIITRNEVKKTITNYFVRTMNLIF